MSNDFESFSNPDFNQQYQNHTDSVQQIAGFATAAAVDFGASVWNSVTPERYNTTTEDLLSNVSSNALRIYDENPDAVHTASFVGGIFVPSGLALKGMNLARAGIKGAGWFADANNVARAAKAEQMFSDAAGATKAYQDLKRTTIAAGIANGFLDGAAMEAAVVGTMNAHPFMEDYMKDPATNFIRNSAIGGVLGAVGGIVANRGIKAMEGRLQSAAADEVLGGYKDVIEGMPRVNKLQVQQANIDGLQTLLDRETTSPLVRQYAGDLLLATKADQAEEFAKLSKDLAGDLPEDTKAALLDKLVNDPRFIGTDAVRYLHQKQGGFINPFKQNKVEFNQDFKYEDFFNDKGKATAVAYSQAFDQIGSLGNIRNIGRAVDVGADASNIGKGYTSMRQAILSPDKDAGFAIWNRSAAEVDKMYAERLAHIDKLDEARLAKAVVAPDDLPTLNALVARASKAPEGLPNLRILVTKEEPNYDVISKRVFANAGVSADHHAKMLEFTNPAAIKSYDMLGRGSSIGGDAKALLSGWRAGSKVAEMRTAADAFFRGGYGGGSELRAAVGAMYNSSESVALRAKFQALADAEGNVYLWRGMKQNPRGHAALESYTTDIEKAKEFGTPRLFKVHVDDILGAIADIGSKDGVMRNEIIVGAPARQMEASLPVMSKAGDAVTNLQALGTTSNKITYAEAHRMLVNLKQDTLDSMIQQGFPAEVMAIRTNTPIDTVKAYMGAGGAKSLDELELPYIEYGSASKMEDYLSPAKKTLILRTNINKVPYAQMRANLDVETMARADQQIKASFFQTSQSAIAQRIGSFFFSPEMDKYLGLLRAQVGNVVSGNAGNKFLQSTDMYTRFMGDFGKIASYIGKGVQHLANSATEQIVKPLSEQMAAIAAKGPAAIAEINTAYAMNAELRGYRLYKDGQFYQKVEKLGEDGKKLTVLEPATFQGREYRVAVPEVDALLKQLQEAGKEMYQLVATQNKILGRRAMPDIGFWVPAYNPTSKWITYAHDKALGTTKLLWGNTEAEMASAVEAFKAANAMKISNGSLLIFDKGQQDLVNKFIGRDDPWSMQIANVERFHSGASAPAIVPMNRNVFENIVQGYEHYITAATRNLADISLSDVTGILEKMAQVEGLYAAKQPLSKVQEFIGKKQNTARIMHNTLLGVNNLNEFTTWKAANSVFENSIGWASQKVGDIWNGAKSLLPSRVQKDIAAGKEVDLKDLDWKGFSDKLAAEGVVNPFKVFDDHIAQQLFGVAKLQESKNVGARAVYASNALAATVALRVGELAQPLVNAMSLPILTTGALAEKLPATFMGAALNTAKIHPVQAMYEGMRAAFGTNPMHRGWDKLWQEQGFYKPLVSEASDVLKLSREFEPGAIAKVEKLLDSKLVAMLSKPADISESLVRKIALFTGGNYAKRMYPELDDVGVTIFARDFMDRVVGNYQAAQRPTAFAGTLGVAMGLFQTYMVTMAQSIYRHLELKNYKGLMKMMLAQETIFGAASMPGFAPISEAIGEHFSDDNVDLVSGTYRALPDMAANMLLYGMPSSAGPAFYTRGELAPRIPTDFGSMPSVNMAAQAIQAGMKVAGAIGSADENAGRAFMQALSAQSISRPLARASELATGYSVTGQGNTIAVPEEVWTPVGIMSRLLATRPLEEAKLRDAIHMNTVYGSLDYEQRQAVTAKLKTALRSGELTSEKLASIAESYMRTGTPQGWRSAVNTAIAQTNTSGRETFLNKLKPNNPLMYMIDKMDE